MMRPLLSGMFTVDDDDLFRHLYLLHQTENLNIEPSAAAGFNGPAMLLNTTAGRRYLTDNGLQNALPQAVHLLWTTGGLFVPDDEYRGFLQRGQRLA
jgi:D-serine dehydratase